MGMELLVAGAIAAAGAAAGVYSANKQASAQREATQQAERNQKKVSEQARQDQRRQNANSADVSGILQGNIDSSLSGGSTLLTGAGGGSTDRRNLGAGNKLG